MKLLSLCIFSLFLMALPLQAAEYQIISGREAGPLYRICVPDEWIRVETVGDRTDTKLPICSFFIREGEKEVRITVHNFPSMEITDRIPPQAQIARWKGQIEGLEERDVSVIPQSFSGYVGFLFKAKGVMGWSMQLGAEHYRQLYLPEERADVTIKVTGPEVLIKTKRKTIYNFARSFELIEEIPTTS